MVRKEYSQNNKHLCFNTLIDRGHSVERNTSYKVIYRIPDSSPYGVRLRLIYTAEAIGT